MKISISGSRSLAISVIAGVFGYFIHSSDVADAARYSDMTKDALIAELASKQTGVGTALTGALIVVLGIVVAVDVLEKFFDAIWRRFGSPPDVVPPPVN